MTKHSRILIGSSLALTAALSATIALAQGDGSPTDTIQIRAGEMLEIGTDAIATKPLFSWILTKDHKFQSAQRSRFFQTRPAQTGTYALDVSIQNAAGSQNEYRAFAIVVTEPGPPDEETPRSGNSLKAVLTTVPAAINDTVYLPPQGGILRLDALRSGGDINSYSIDLDSLADSDGDGNPTNDRDNQDTFSARSGSPLLVYMSPKSGDRIVTLTVRSAANGQTAQAILHLRFSPPPSGQAQSAVQNTNNVIEIQGSDGNAHFSAHLPENQTTGKELLYEWDFGDKSRSLLTSPFHTYSAAGTFGVSLTVRNIKNGQVVYQGTSSVHIQGTPTKVSSISSSSASSEASTDTASTSSFGSIVKVGMIILLLLALAVGMYMAFTWIKRKTAGHLSATLENMEKTIVKTEKTPDATAEPLKIKKESTPAPTQTTGPKAEEISEREKSNKEFASAKSDNPVPTSSVAPVPSWLAKASSVPVAQPTAKTPEPAKPPAPSIAPQTPKPETSAPVPDWLKQTPTPVPAPIPVATPKAPPAATKPAPVPAAAPKPAAAPIATPVAPKPATATPAQAPAKAPAVAKETKTVSPATETPKPIAKEIPKKTNDDEPPIAIIKADSLTK